ncbi:uncharacterized protein LOC108474483 [Gossypium arboreum]|uniref:uncharacterized protein LOC108474483 n=1 Tax=Gossypium arboreum TaxID=29729 RepID=UPI000818FCF8|nr:uncharacterized protein LOC108474483 [Gossypium arboreum]
MVPYEALYGHRCCTPSCRTELGEWHVLGLELVFDIEDKVRLIQDRIKAALDRQKSYMDLKHKKIEYFVGDFIFLKVSPWKKHYRSDPTQAISVEEIEVRPDLTFEEEPIQILERDVMVLRRKYIQLVNVISRGLKPVFCIGCSVQRLNRTIKVRFISTPRVLTGVYKHNFDCGDGQKPE